LKAVVRNPVASLKETQKVKISSLLLVGAIVATTSLALGNGNYMYGYVTGHYECIPEYGNVQYICIVSNVLQYCPYGPQAFDGPQFAEQEGNGNMARQAALGCIGDLRVARINWRGTFNNPVIAASSAERACMGGQTIMLSTYVPNTCTP
jgi:hypothetical protein